MDSPAPIGQTGHTARVAMMRHFWADNTASTAFTPLSWKQRMLFVALAAGSFHVAYAVPVLAFVIVGWLYGLFRLSEVGTARQAFWIGVLAALAAFVPHVAWFWNLFKFGALALWMVLPFWIGLFVVVMRFVRVRFGFKAACLLAPFVWTGFEFFRSELYPLRFSWLIPGYAFYEDPEIMLVALLGGMYGVGFWLMALVCVDQDRRSGGRFGKYACNAVAAYLIGLFLYAMFAVRLGSGAGNHPIKVAGVQVEGQPDLVVLDALQNAHRKHPAAELFVLNELSFDGPVSPRVRAWCRTNQVHLIAGGKEFLGMGKFYNTAFVIGPDGEIVFKQVKSRPVQFVDDGLPAPSQDVWRSQFDRIGICICYDLSFTRVTDELVRKGAKALVVPTMDSEEWGEYQHKLHARVAPVRAAEYGFGIFRVASSGISQLVDSGIVKATAPFPGQGETIAGDLWLRPSRARTLLPLPLDRYLVWPCVVIAFGLLGWHVVEGVRSRFNPQSVPRLRDNPQ